MIAVAFDPSSTKTGYAVGVLERGVVVELREAGLLAKRSTDPMVRIASLHMDVEAMLVDVEPELVVIETPAPQAPKGGRGRRGQAVYGMAVGAVLGAVWAWRGDRGGDVVRDLVATRADEWTRGIPKAKRNEIRAATWPAYAEAIAGARGDAGDAGGDVGDAIGLLEWAAAERVKAARGDDYDVIVRSPDRFGPRPGDKDGGA